MRFPFLFTFYVSLQNLILSSVSFHVSRLSPLLIPFFRFAQPFPCLSTIYAVFSVNTLSIADTATSRRLGLETEIPRSWS